MLDDALSYPRRDDRWLATTLVGGVLYLLTWIPFLPEIALGGYLARVLESPRDAAPPRFDDWEDLLVDGVRVLVVWLVYTLVPAAIVGAFAAALTLTVGAAAVTLSADPGAGAGALGVAAFALVLALWALAVALGLAAAYVAPAATALAAREGRVAAGFDLPSLRTVLADGNYAGAWLRAVLVAVVGGAVGAMLVVVFFLGAFVLFYVTVAATRLVAVGVDDALAPAVADGDA